MSKKATLHSTLRRVLSIGNEDQNQHYPPGVYSEHVNILTDAILDEVNVKYPGNRSIVEIAKPFLEILDVKVENGMIEMPEDLRHLLSITIFKNSKGEACDRSHADLTDEEASEKRLEYRDGSVDVEILDSTSEYNRRTQHKYKKITLNKAIAIGRGETKMKINPYNVPMVQLAYLRHPKTYFYGYVMNLDGTYYFDPNTSEEMEWDDTASDILFKGINILYSNYTRDEVQMSAAQLLKEKGLL